MSTPSVVDKPDALMAKCRLHNRSVAELRVVDISLAGCMVERRAWTFKPGERVLVKLPNLEYQTASVVWCDDDHVGIAFENLLYEPVLNRLRKQLDGRS